MKICQLICVFLLSCSALFGQEALPVADSTEVDLRYREDQFYLGLSYNLLLNRPEGLSQRNLSYGLQLGFIRDMPLNASRTVALGVGLGYGVNSYYTNLRAIRAGGDIQYFLLSDSEVYKRNKIETHLIEVPIQLRWRNSNPTETRFWRIYGGVALGYVVGSRSKFVSQDVKDSFYNTDVEKFRYGLMLNIGYNTFNLQAYYGLNTLFQDGVQDVDGRPLDMVPLHLGLIFYIL
jgi:hypothetical protein